VENGKSIMVAEEAIESTMTNNTSAHDKVVINQWPKVDDSREHRIVGAIKDQLLCTDWARDVFKQTANAQLKHLKISLQHLDTPQFIHDYTQEVLSELAGLTNSKIITGQEYLDTLPKGQPVLLLTNHLGSYKINSSPIEELRKTTGLTGPVQPIFYPFPLYYSAMYPIAKALGDNLYIASFEYPGRLGEVLRAAGSIEVPPKDDLPKGKNRTEILIDSTRRLIEAHPNAVITSFPEGGTTGKRNGGGPYDLGEFHTGSYVIAKDLGLTILPAAQYFNPDSGFEVGVFKPIHPVKNTSNEQLAKMADATQSKIQAWLNQGKISS